MNYFLSFDRPAEQIFTVRIHSMGQAGAVRFFLPRWRPGRYELQRYEINVSDVRAFIPGGASLPVERKGTHEWEVQAPDSKQFIFEYKYYADKLNGGASFFDDERILVNGVNCLMYREEHLATPCQLHLDLPEGFEAICGLEKKDGYWDARDYHQLVDSPVLAGRDLKRHRFKVNDVDFNFWFLGQGHLDVHRLEEDVIKFAEVQMGLFGDYPGKDFHFLFFLRPDTFRHGVEHHNSTVIVIGPGFRLQQPAMYRSLVELCSHELFHVWNVKAIRPEDMLPYDYGRENYSTLHYVTEGITTYYGDLAIWKAGLWNTQEWLQSINGELRNFFQRGGKDFTSLEQASFESWVNGYHRNGTPNRRISFYTKGYLVAFLLDIEIRRLTSNARSLDDVLFEMYQRFGKAGKGYNRESFKALTEEVAGADLTDFFKAFYYTAADLEAALQSAGAYVGWEMARLPLDTQMEARFGLRYSYTDRGEARVDTVLPESPALDAGLSKGDEIISINEQKVVGNIEELLDAFDPDMPLRLHFFRRRKLKNCLVLPSGDYLRLTPQFLEVSNPTQRQAANRAAWQEVRSSIQVVTRKL